MFRKISKVMGNLFKDNNNQPKTGQGEPQAEPLSFELTINRDRLKLLFGNTSDVVIREFKVGGNTDLPALICYVEGMVDKLTINESILDPLMTGLDFQIRGFPTDFALIQKALEQKALTIGEVKEAMDLKELLDGILTGNTGILFDGSTKALLANTKGWDARSVSEPVTESVVRGPREGFTETLRTNTALLRRRIKTPQLRFESMKVGNYSKTEVVLAYIASLADEKVVEEARKRLTRIQIDGILESGYIEELIEDNPFSPFPQIEHSERPDKVAAAMLEGRVGIMVDGTPFVLLIPTIFFQFLQSSEDYYERYFIGGFIRWVRGAAFFIALLLPSIYIAVTTIHQEMIPTPLALSIAGAREGVPFPAFVEAVIMEISFELLREAGVRLPQPVGQAVSIVGALVIGQAAVEAGLVSPVMVIIVSLTGIASFSLPAYNLAITLRLLRFPMMAVAAVLGLPGIVIALLIMLTHLTSLRSFGIPYLSPVAPASYRDLKDVVVRVPWWAMFLRPRMIGYKKPQRQAYGLRPNPERGKGGGARGGRENQRP